MKDEEMKVSADIDWAFVRRLAVRGYVRVYTSQVSFKIFDGNGLQLGALQLPDNCRIEWLGSDRSAYQDKLFTSITFRFLSAQEMEEEQRPAIT